MVRNDDFFLQKWVSYYGAQLGKENLYIFFDGLDQRIPKFCNETNAFLHEKIGKHVVEAEKCRLKFLSDQATKLFNNGYDLIVGVDADEYIVVDPKLEVGLREYLSSQNRCQSVSHGFGFWAEVG